MKIAFRKGDNLPWHDIVGKVIMLFTKKYRHVEFVFSDDTWFGAVAGGSRFTDDISGNPDKWDYIKINEIHEAKIRYTCEIIEGRKYDWAGLLSFASFGLIKQDPRAFYCSELVRWVLGLKNIGILPRWKGERCPPSGKGGLYEMLT